MVSSKALYVITQPFVLSRQQAAQGTWQNFIVPLTGIYYRSSAVNYVIPSYFRICCLREWREPRINGTCAVDKKTKSVTPAWTSHSFLRLLEQITPTEWLRRCRCMIVQLWKFKCKTVLTGQKSRGCAPCEDSKGVWLEWCTPKCMSIWSLRGWPFFGKGVFTDAISKTKTRSYCACQNDHRKTFHKQ